MRKTDIINILSKSSGQYGEWLIELMNEYNADNLCEISEEQAEEYYIAWKRRFSEEI